MNDRLEHEKSLITLSTGDARLTVQFFWHNDRFSHRILMDGQSDACASSLAGDAEADWPASPPIQQLSEEVIDGRPVILGVGSAGRSHWSVSVQPVQNEHGHALTFEWACRHKSKAGFLGTTYRGRPSLKLAAGPDAALVLRDDKTRDDKTMVIEPTTQTDSGTDRWSYTAFSEPLIRQP